MSNPFFVRIKLAHFFNVGAPLNSGLNDIIVLLIIDKSKSSINRKSRFEAKSDTIFCCDV